MRYERKDDMLFGQWQAQLMLEKGQTTEGVRIDKKITVNPLFKDFIPKGRSAAGSAAGFLGKINTDKTNLALPMSSTTKIDSRFDIQRAIGAVVKWDKEPFIYLSRACCIVCRIRPGIECRILLLQI